MNPLDDSRCTQTTAAGRRCKMPRVNSHVTLCGTHLEAQRCRLRSEPAHHAQDLLDGVTDLRSATSINHVLGNLTALLTDGRIDYRKAAVIAYLCQLLLQTISMARHERWDDDSPPGTLAPHRLPLAGSAPAAGD